MGFFDWLVGPPSEKSLAGGLRGLLHKRKVLFQRIKNLRDLLGESADRAKLPREVIESNIKTWQQALNVPELRIEQKALQLAKYLEEYAGLREDIIETIAEMRRLRYNPIPILDEFEKGLGKALS